MSLINTMLRDLDKRESLEPAMLTTINTNPVRKLQTGWLSTLFRPVLKCMLLGFSLWFLYQTGRQHEYLPISYALKIPDRPDTASNDPEAIVQTEPLPAVSRKPLHDRPKNSIGRVPEPETTASPPVQAQSNSLPVTATPPVRKMPVPAARNRKTVTPVQQAAARFSQAQKQDSPDLARSLLEETLRLDPGHLEARIALSRMLLRQGLDTEAAVLLDQSLRLFPDNLQLIKARARLLIQEKNIPAALQTLQSASAQADRDETYLALLAAVYRQMRKYRNSAEIYRHLLQIDPGKAESWLGLAISLEQTGDAKEALYAYRRALHSSPLAKNIVAYIKQRLVLLK